MAINLSKANRRGSAHPEGVVTGNKGDLYEQTGTLGGAFVKKHVDNATAGWHGLAEKSRAPGGSASRYYVAGSWGHDNADGLSWGSGFASIGAAITALAGVAGEIMVAQGTYIETLTINSSVIIRGAGAGYSGVIVQAPSAAANCINIVSPNAPPTFQNVTTAGFPGQWTGIGWNLDNAPRTRLVRCGHYNAASDTTDATYGGTALKLSNNTEGCVIEGFLWRLPRIGIHCATEGSTNTFIESRGDNARMPLLIDGNGGGNKFLGWKSQGSGIGTPIEVISIGGGGDNLFVGFDADEAGPNLATVSSSNNTFINSVSAPSCAWTVSGHYNHFVKHHMLGADMTVSGDRNVFESPELADSNSNFIFTGTDNILRDEVGGAAPSGTGYARAIYRDTAGVAKSGTTRNAYPWVGVTVAPADSEIAAGQAFFWFDSTNGAAKLKVKGKEAGGTVRTGEVALA